MAFPYPVPKPERKEVPMKTIASVSFDEQPTSFIVTIRRHGSDQAERYEFQSREDAERFCLTLR